MKKRVVLEEEVNMNGGNRGQEEEEKRGQRRGKG